MLVQHDTVLIVAGFKMSHNRRSEGFDRDVELKAATRKRTFTRFDRRADNRQRLCIKFVENHRFGRKH